MPITFTLSGSVASKKNSQRGVIRGGSYFRIPSRQHEEWHTRASWELKSQMCTALHSLGRQNYAFPIVKCAITMRFWSSSLRRFDLDNRATSTLDLLVDCGVLKDDSWHVVPELRLFYMGRDREKARVEIAIEPITAR